MAENAVHPWILCGLGPGTSMMENVDSFVPLRSKSMLSTVNKGDESPGELRSPATDRGVPGVFGQGIVPEGRSAVAAEDKPNMPTFRRFGDDVRSIDRILCFSSKIAQSPFRYGSLGPCGVERRRCLCNGVLAVGVAWKASRARLKGNPARSKFVNKRKVFKGGSLFERVAALEAREREGTDAGHVEIDYL